MAKPLASAEPFSVVSFNTYGPIYAPNVRARTQNFIADIAGHPCELLLLQEVWREGQRNLLQAGLQALGYQAHSFDVLRADGVRTGLFTAVQRPTRDPLLHRFPINNQRGLDWVRGAFGIEKGFGVLDFALDPSSGTQEPAHWVRSITLHLHPSRQTVQIAQVVHLLEWILTQEDWSLPLIVGGDLNAPPNSLVMRLLRDGLGLRDVWQERHATYAAGTCTYCRANTLSLGGPDRVIDYIFVRSGVLTKLSVLEAHILNQFAANPRSDHYGLRADLSWEPQSQGVSNQALALARMEQLLSTLRAARAVLERSGDPQFSRSLESLALLEQRLEQSDGRLAEFFALY